MPETGTRPRVLFVLHNFHNRAGTEEHTKLLGSELQERYEIAYLFPQDGTVVLRHQDNGEEIALAGTNLPWPLTPKSDATIERSLKQALAIFPPDLIHIQHAFYWPLSVVDRLCDTGIPVIMSFHEYFAITPLFTMIGTENPEVALSESYVKQIFGADIRPYLIERQRFLAAAFSRLKHRIVPSQMLAAILQKVYPGGYRVIPHGIRSFTPAPPLKSEAVRFGYVGSMLPQKGWRELVRAWPAVREQHPTAELHFFGGSEQPSTLPAGAFVHGVYDQVDLPQILSQIHIGVLPSVFAETFSLVLSEMQLAGLPVAASSMGVFRERIKPGATGWLFDPFSAEEISEVLGKCVADQSWRKWKIPKPRLASEMARDYDSLYRELL